MTYAEGGIRTRTPRGATPSRWCVCQFHHFGEVDFRPLLLFRRRGRRCRSRSTLLLLRLLRSLSRLLLLLLPLFRAFPDNRRTAGLRNQNGQRQRRDHEDNGGDRGGLTEDRTGAACAECGLSPATAESPCPVGAFALLQQHDKNQKDANDDVKNR